MNEERLLAMLSHLLAIVPGVGILAPLIIYIIKKDESAFVRDNARESLNFQLTVIILYIIAGLSIFLVIGIFLFWVVGVVNTILVIVATVRASDGRLYRYPVNLRLI